MPARLWLQGTQERKFIQVFNPVLQPATGFQRLDRRNGWLNISRENCMKPRISIPTKNNRLHSGRLKSNRVQVISTQSTVPLKIERSACEKDRFSSMYCKPGQQSLALSDVVFCNNTWRTAVIAPSAAQPM